MQQTHINQKPLAQSHQDQYDNQQFQTPSDDSYLSKVQKLFTLPYQNSSYHQIQLSTTQMRHMMKQVSKILDQKLHKYYGLMGLKHQQCQSDVQFLRQKLTKQSETNNKLIETQITQIKQIQLIDEQMASSKRMQKQADRLRQYFETKKAMIQSDKQARFSKGQMNKAGQYLARDLDSQKYYFRLNKIKQGLEYAMLKQRDLTKKTDDLQVKYQQLLKRHEQMNQIYNQKLSQASSMNLLIEENKQFYNQYHLKRELIRRKQEQKKKIQVLKYNIQNTVMKINSDVQKMRKLQKQQNQKLSIWQQRITTIEKQINQQLQKEQITKKVQQNLSIKNIDSLLKNKKIKNQSFIMMKNSSQLSRQQNGQIVDVKINVDLGESSSILLKPNFKIKQFLSKSRSKIGVNDKNNRSMIVNKSMDLVRNLSKNRQLRQLLQQYNKKVVINDKRVLKWQPRKRASEQINSRLLPLIQTINNKNKSKDIRVNPQNVNEQMIQQI